MLSYRYIDSESAFSDVLAALENQSRFALDTEFHREHTYWPQPALIQLAWLDGLALVDPLMVDMRRLAPLIDSERLVVVHAASQDLDVLYRCCGVLPRRIFDTQIASGFVGGGVPSLSSLYASELGLRLNKDLRLTNWLTRPLEDMQLEYAASDVAYLLEVHDRLSARLDDLQRAGWVETECSLMLDKVFKLHDPANSWKRVKNVRSLEGQSAAVANALSIWRQERAISLDVPVRHVMSDMAIISVSQTMPRTEAELTGVRGINTKNIKNGQGAAIINTVCEGMESKWRPPQNKLQMVSLPARKLKPIVSLIAVWVRQIARAHKIEPSLLATRADIEAFLREEECARLSFGWRAKLVAEPIRQLTTGEASLAIETNRLVIEPREPSVT